MIQNTENYLNVSIFKTFVSKMRTIIKKPYWNILSVFYKNKNKQIHLRELSRRINLKEGPLSRHLNNLVEEKILQSENEANLKKFKIKTSKIPEIFTLFHIERYNQLPSIRKNSIKFYLQELKEKPIFIILFGSTAKQTYKSDSDIDIIAVFNKKTKTNKARKYAEAQTGIIISEFQLTYDQFINEMKLKEDQVIQAGIETGFPAYNHLFYEELKIGQ
jgi:predicted nucleotidyltransferase